MRAARQKAIQHLDLVVSHLDRPMREQFLARSLTAEVLEEAERGGLTVERDPRSHRLTLR